MLNLIFVDRVASVKRFEVFSGNDEYLPFDAKRIQKNRALPSSVTWKMNVFVIINKQAGDSVCVFIHPAPFLTRSLKIVQF